MVLGTPTDRFEQKFQPRLTEARELAYVFANAMPESVPGDEMPDSTVFRLLLATVPLYHAAILNLSEAETTLGTVALLRSLIETWTHVFFIWNGADDRGCRALRLERGWATESVALARAAKDDMPGGFDKAVERERQVLELWDRSGCASGRSRNYNNVRSTIDAIKMRFPNLDWVYPQWMAGSQVAHVGGWDWMLADRGDGSSAAVLPSPSHRAGRLNHVAVVFSNVAAISLDILGVDLATGPGLAFDVAAKKLLDNRFLMRAMEGDFDG